MAKNYYCPNYSMRTAIIVTVTNSGKYTDTHSTMMTDNAFNAWKFKMRVDGKDFRSIDDNTVLIIRDERKGEL